MISTKVFIGSRLVAVYQRSLVRKDIVLMDEKENGVFAFTGRMKNDKHKLCRSQIIVEL